MKCFNHEEISAVGICKHCNKGICPICLTDTGDGLACIGHCTDEVVAINKMIEHNKKIIKETPGGWTSSALLYLGMGAIMLITNYVYIKKVNVLFTGMGVLMVGYGIYILIKGKDYKKNK